MAVTGDQRILILDVSVDFLAWQVHRFCHGFSHISLPVSSFCDWVGELRDFLVGIF